MNEINDQVKWEMLSYEEKNHQLFLKQKALLKKYGIGEGLVSVICAAAALVVQFVL